MYFLYTNNEYAEKAARTSILFIIASTMENLGINLAKEGKTSNKKKLFF